MYYLIGDKLDGTQERVTINNLNPDELKVLKYKKFINIKVKKDSISLILVRAEGDRSWLEVRYRKDALQGPIGKIKLPTPKGVGFPSG